MTTSLMASTGASDLAIREPAQAELERVLYLFRKSPLSAEARLLGAARSLPVERFVAAVAWWPEGMIARFQLACQPGVDRAAVAGPLIERLSDCAHRAGMEALHYADLLPANHECAEVL